MTRKESVTNTIKRRIDFKKTAIQITEYEIKNAEEKTPDSEKRRSFITFRRSQIEDYKNDLSLLEQDLQFIQDMSEDDYNAEYDEMLKNGSFDQLADLFKAEQP